MLDNDISENPEGVGLPTVLAMATLTEPQYDDRQTTAYNFEHAQVKGLYC